VTNVTILLSFAKLEPKKSLTSLHCGDVKDFNIPTVQSLVKHTLTFKKWPHVTKNTKNDVKVEVFSVAKGLDSLID
jgi:hypothetical protein